MTKDRILAEIKRTADENGGVSLGQRGFANEKDAENDAREGDGATLVEGAVCLGFADTSPCRAPTAATER